MVDIISKYFQLSDKQKDQFTQIGELYKDWNSKINLISRKDIDNLYPHHILHSLGIAQMIRFKEGTDIIDFGTGGGFPGIPLAIMFPNANFLLVDSIGKKVKVAGEIAKEIGLENVEIAHSRAEDINRKFDFVVSRAVMELDALVGYSKKLVHHNHKNGMPNGLVCLKGGELQNEIKKFKNMVEVQDLYPSFEEEYFKTKKVIYLPL